MEMSSDCLRQEPLRTGRPVRGPHGGWQKQEIDALQKSIDEAAQTGESLRSVFERLGETLGRKPNSIRNFYYAQVRAQSQELGRALPFETFSPGEVERLVENVLTARAQGMSVRACVRRLAEGDRTLMLRYQNKYRSILKNKPEMLLEVAEELRMEGLPCPQDVTACRRYERAMKTPDTLRRLESHLADPSVRAMAENLLVLLEKKTEEEQADAQAKWARIQRENDRLKVENDLLKMALEDREKEE